VIWTWTGPDTQHSVTGQGLNDDIFGPDILSDASQWDSDAGTSEPRHTPGDTYKVTFDQPGTYVFQCKLHSVVRGVVTVSDTPGDPDSDPGPEPKVNFDIEAPHLDGYFFTRDGTYPAPGVIGPKGKGIGFSYQLSEGGNASVDYYRLVRRGGSKRTLKVYKGYQEWPSHIGVNLVRFAGRSANFSPVPGNYMARFHIEDASSNDSDDVSLRFKIKTGKKS